MVNFTAAQSKAVRVGSAAGWLLEFFAADAQGELSSPVALFSSSRYYATIEASLRDGLSGGSYSFMLQALTDADYGLISRAKDKDVAVAARLYLFWYDALSGATSYLKNLAGIASELSGDDLAEQLVAVLHVDSVKRKPGELGYDTEIHCSEWAYRRMLVPLNEPFEASTYPDAAEQISKKTKVKITTYPPNAQRLTTDAAGVVGGEKVAYPKGKTYGNILNDIAQAVESNLNQYGRGMLLIRDGEIHLGPRPIPLVGEPKDLTAATGLLEATLESSTAQDPSAPDPSGAKQQLEYVLTVKGRADLKPGDEVRFDVAPEDDRNTTPGLGQALLGSFGASFLPSTGDALSKNAKSMVVTSVKHRQGKDAGFYTELKGVVPADPSQPWDRHEDTGGTAKPHSATPSSDGGAEAAAAIKEHLSFWSSNQHTVDIGQVRQFTAKKVNDQSPSQTEKVWEGLQPLDRNPNGTRRLPVDKKNAVRADLPYSTSFAWGKCGLVLPRYPGMRVVLVHRRGMEHEPIEIGALWDSGQGPDSEPGDYWLSLPMGVSQEKRAKADDDDQTAAHNGAVTNDLIDADGNRVIEVGSLSLKVPKKAGKAGTRPKPLRDRSITIEHEGGAKIVMKQDGSILIKGTGITLDAGSGTIVLKGGTVDVQ
jgi:hypothetical protein